MRRIQVDGTTFPKHRKAIEQNFQMALGNLAPASEVLHLNLPLQKEALKAHTVKGIKHNLLSVNKLAAAGYRAEFERNTVKFYDTYGHARQPSQQAVLEGWYIPDEGLWRIPLVQTKHFKSDNEST